MRVTRVGVWVIGAVLGILLITSTAYGTCGYTPINSPPQGEKTHAEILADTYGGTFTSDGGGNFNGSGDSAGISARRVYDFDNEQLRIHVLNGGPGNIDQIWTDGTVYVTAEAKYADFTQSFGWNGGGTGTNNYIELLTQEDIGNGGVEVMITGDFLWGHQAQHWDWWEPDREWWSLESANACWYYEEDHMVTYYMEGAGAPGETVWMLFIEDEKLCDSDKDYNDFVIEITATPEPITLGLLSVGALLIRRRKK